MLYLIRHGQTDWNQRRKLQGRTDVPLNDEGRKMAENAAKEYKDVHFDVCYCSPLTRAKETAEILLKGRSIPIIYDDRLMEMSFGEAEGLENCFDRPETPIRTFFFEPENYTDPPKGGETLDDLCLRTGSFLEEIVFPELEKGKDILIVGHGAMNSSIISNIKKLPRKEFWSTRIRNCELIKVDPVDKTISI